MFYVWVHLDKGIKSKKSLIRNRVYDWSYGTSTISTTRNNPSNITAQPPSPYPLPLS